LTFHARNCQGGKKNEGQATTAITDNHDRFLLGIDPEKKVGGPRDLTVIPVHLIAPTHWCNPCPGVAWHRGH